MNELLERIGKFIEQETGYSLTSTLKEEFGSDLEALLEQEYEKGYNSGLSELED